MMERHLGRKPEELLTDMNHSEAEANNAHDYLWEYRQRDSPSDSISQNCNPNSVIHESLIVLSHLGVTPQLYNLKFSAELNITHH